MFKWLKDHIATMTSDNGKSIDSEIFILHGLISLIVVLVPVLLMIDPIKNDTISALWLLYLVPTCIGGILGIIYANTFEKLYQSHSSLLAFYYIAWGILSVWGILALIVLFIVFTCKHIFYDFPMWLVTKSDDKTKDDETEQFLQQLRDRYNSLHRSVWNYNRGKQKQSEPVETPSDYRLLAHEFDLLLDPYAHYGNSF